jgi:putative transposase
MPNYRRAWVAGGTFFLTLVTEGRAPLFADPAARRWLHEAIAATRQERPFDPHRSNSNPIACGAMNSTLQ